MAFATVGKFEFAYERSGPEETPPIILIRGLGTQMVQWPDNLLTALHAGGYGTVIFDNRDVGLSSKCQGQVDFPAITAAIHQGNTPDVPYRLADMADDVCGLMDQLDIPRAHIAGISMGGMIAQIMAADRSERVLTMTSIMSSSGNPEIPFGPARDSLTSRPQFPDDRSSVIDHKLAVYKQIAGPDYAMADAAAKTMLAASYDRCHYPEGVARQMAAVMADGNRIPRLQTIQCPSLVIHGTDDPLIVPEAGTDTAQHIPGAELELISGMGHDISPSLAPLIAARLLQFLNDHPS